MASTRTARLELTRTQGRSVLHVALPRDTGTKELLKVNEFIVNKVIKDLTGCACLSGMIDVIFQEHFEKVINVNMTTGGVVG